jgi:hypothetical protein
MKTTKFMSEAFGLSEDGTLVGEGPTARRKAVRDNPRRRQAALEAKSLLKAAWDGDRTATNMVNEAITTNDLFRDAVGQVMDVEMVQAYQTETPAWESFAKRTTVRNFKPKTLRSLIGTNYSLPKVPEHSPYPLAPGLDREDQQIAVEKFGERYGYTLEARINDEIGELQEVPGQWAQVARRTENDAALKMLANPVTGAPQTGFFNAGHGNLGTGALTPSSLDAAYTTATVKRDTSGRLITAPQMQLVVGPMLRSQANRVLNTSEIQRTLEDGSKVTESNPFRGLVTLNVLPNLPGTAWFLIPVTSAVRPAFWVGFLTGFETPDVRQKADQGQALGGGQAGDGSFDDDTIWFRVRHIVGAATGDWTFTYASDGIAA